MLCLVFVSLIFAEQYKELCEVKMAISQLKGRINYTAFLLWLMSFTFSIPKFWSYSASKLQSSCWHEFLQLKYIFKQIISFVSIKALLMIAKSIFKKLETFKF